MNQKFLHIFADIEQLLCERVAEKTVKKPPVSQLIDQYAKKNPLWKDAARELHHFREIRNFLSHERSEQHGFPVEVTENAIARLSAIKQALKDPQPISAKHRKDVTQMAPESVLADVLKKAYAKQYSQFPVMEGTDFKGLITENEITRWQGLHVEKHGANVDLAAITVDRVLNEKEPEHHPSPIFRFEEIEAREQEVMALFITHPMLEAVLLTRSGDESTAIEGIVTQWDAARYST